MPSLDPLSRAGKIERLEILNAKSYKFRQVVGPFPNFAAVLVADGAGRSDQLVEAISFIIGVRSFRLRGNLRCAIDDTRTEFSGDQRASQVALVKLVFSTSSGEQVEFGRRIISSGISEYRISNIPVTWDIYHNTMKGLDLLGEFELDPFNKDFKEPIAVSEELKKCHVEVENPKAPAEEKMVPNHQKRMMFAAQRKLEREKTLERDSALKHRAELDLKAAEARMKVDFNVKMESLPAVVEKTASDFEALDQYEILRKKETKSWERFDAARAAAIQLADKRKSATKPRSRPTSQPSSRPTSRPSSRPTSRPSSRPPSRPVSRPVSPVPMFDCGDVAALNEVKVPERTGSKSRFNATSNVAESRENGQSAGIVSKDIANGHGYDPPRVETRKHGGSEVPLAGMAVQQRPRRRHGSLDGTMSLALAEERRCNHTPRRADRCSWPGATTPPHILRTLEDYDDQMFWSDLGKDLGKDHHLEPGKDSLCKAEELAEELYRDAMEVHSRLVAEEDADVAATSGVSAKGHNQIAETKETCGDIMYADGRSEAPVVTPLLIPAENSESRSVSFSQTSQCSDTPGSQSEQAQREASVLSFSAGSMQLNEVAKGEEDTRDCMVKAFTDFRDREIFLEKEMNSLRASSVRKQAKIDSLQKWRAYYSHQLEAKDKFLDQMEKKHMKEMKKKGRAVTKLEKAHMKDIAHRDAKWEAMEEKLRSDIKELNLVIEELSGQLYDMEEHLAAGGIPYKPAINENTGPSSRMLLSAVIGVKEAAHTFSRTFMSFLKRHLTKARDLDEQICLESEVIVAQPSDYKFLVQSFILRRMFLDFDSECFNIDSCMTEIYDIEDHSRACFDEYMSHRNVAETVTLLTDNRAHSGFLREFCFKKFLHIVSESTEEAFFGEFNHSDDICAGRHPSSRFYESYCRLAVSVWLLHRLAFSFQPPARMISVRKGAQFNPTYMESAVPGISSGAVGDDGAALPFEALVGLMVHPGFRIGSSVILAQHWFLRGWPFRVMSSNSDKVGKNCKLLTGVRRRETISGLSWD